MTSAFSPPSDRRAAAEFVAAPLADSTAGSPTQAPALVARADADPAYRLDLIAGLALSMLDQLMRRHRGNAAAVREELELTLLDVQVDEVDDDA